MGVYGHLCGFMDFYECLWVSECLWIFMGVIGVYGYLWASMDVYGYFWVSMNVMGVYGCLWVSMGIYECLWSFMGIYECQWIFMGFYGCLRVSRCLWVFIGLYGWLWVFMSVNGCHGLLWVFMGFWISMGIYRCPWVYIGVYGCLWVPICVFRFLGVCGGLWVSGYLWVLRGGMNLYGYYIWTLKILPIFSFKNPRRFENSKKRLKSHITTGERDFIDSSVKSFFPRCKLKKWRWGRLSQISRGNLSQVVCVCVLQYYSRIHHTSPGTMHLYVYIKRKCLSFFYYFRPRKMFCRTLCYFILQRTRLN